MQPAGTSEALEVTRPVESEHRAGVDLAWIVVSAVVLCVLAIVFAVPDGLLGRIDDINGLNVNGVLALMVVVPVGATVFAYRRYRDAVGAQHELARLSLHDSLTGLPNRRHLREVMPEALLQARRHNTSTGVFFVDLDGFKSVNDTYGHEVGDRLMVAVSHRLQRSIGDERWVARYAGDEFVIIDPAPQTREHCARFAEQLVELIEVPFELGEDRIAISASIGVAFGHDDSDPEAVLREADVAMYDAKRSNRRTSVFSESMRAGLTPASAERRLENALAEGEFRLLFQPIVALRTNRIVGAEALLRWDDPERGMIPPSDFLGSLEDTGLIVPVGRWVLEQTCRQAAKWAELGGEGGTPIRVTSNVSPRQIAQSDFADDLRTALMSTGVDPALIYLELTETSLIADARAAWTALSAVRSLGVGLALDNFGTGYSSLSHLRNFDLELLKLDASYVAGLAERATDDAIVRHVVALARELGIATLGEGITEARQVTRLVELGCELGQGFYFSEPQPPTIIDGLLRDQMGHPTQEAGQPSGSADAVVEAKPRQTTSTT